MTVRECVRLRFLEFRHFGGQVLDKVSEGLNIGYFLVSALARHCSGFLSRILGVLH